MLQSDYILKLYHKMGIVFHGSGLIKGVSCRAVNSRQRAFKVLTRKNVLFLKSLGLRVKLGGK